MNLSSSVVNIVLGAKPSFPCSTVNREPVTASGESKTLEGPIARKLSMGGIPTAFASKITVLLVACCLLQAHAIQSQASATPRPAASEDSSSVPDSGEQTKEPAPEHKGVPAKPGARDKIPEQAWNMLAAACEDSKVVDRAKAVRVLGLLPNNSNARRLAEKALEDEKPEVRLSGAAALGDMRSRTSISKLRKTLDDSDVSVALAAAHSLLLMHDHSAYEVYYEVLTQQKKATKGLIARQMSTLRDPKKIAMLAFEEGIGFVPFASIGWSAIKEIRKDDASPVRAAAVTVLTEDQDPATTKALLDATQDNSWLVRAAALESLARRGNPSVLSTVELGLNDEKDVVRFTAAAATVRLNTIQRTKFHARKAQKRVE